MGYTTVPVYGTLGVSSRFNYRLQISGEAFAKLDSTILIIAHQGQPARPSHTRFWKSHCD
jgi:hypothetical protein